MHYVFHIVGYHVFHFEHYNILHCFCMVYTKYVEQACKTVCMDMCLLHKGLLVELHSIYAMVSKHNLCYRHL